MINDIGLDLVPEPTWAKWTNQSLRSVQRARAEGRGPAYVRIGRKVYYRTTAIREYLDSIEQVPPRSPVVERKP